MNKFQESELRAEFKNTIIKIMNIAKIRTTPDEVDQVVDEYFSSFVLTVPTNEIRKIAECCV